MEDGLSFPQPKKITSLPKTLQQSPSEGYPELPSLHYFPGK